MGDESKNGYYSHFNKGVFLNTNTFGVFSSIVISADLLVSDRVDRRTLAEEDVVAFLKQSELPLDEGVVVRVHISCDEGSSVINTHTETLKIFSGVRVEVSSPEFRVFELREFLKVGEKEKRKN